MKRCAFMLALMLASTVVKAQELHPFVRGSEQAIVSSHHGHPFILALWSLDCIHCRDDMALFGKLEKKYRDLNLVLVSTDAPEQKMSITRMLRQYRLKTAESWVFADEFTERLRYEIDPQWYGELPRTYFFYADGHATAISGKIDAELITKWMRETHG